MTDVFSIEKRQNIMRSVKGKNTKPEILVRKFLHKNGLRFRIHDKKLPGSPDIKLTRFKVVIFVNGCFWHKHNSCSRFRLPKTNALFWQNKIDRNINRDIENHKKLKDLGWEVYVIWECWLKKSSIVETFNNLKIFLDSK